MRAIIPLTTALILSFASMAFANETQMKLAAAGGSCSASYKLCVKRCRGLPNPSCVSEVCGGKLDECNSTGCWQDAPRFGGQKTCGLRRG
jgi:hypothetical protein